jgi:hypothetical protein
LEDLVVKLENTPTTKPEERRNIENQMEHLANDLNNNYNNLEGLNGWIQGMEAEQQHWKDEVEREK